jgi:hypothetical protein
MFGYVRPLKAELKVREFEIFRSYYCGICNVIGKKSKISRLMITYDMTFLALLLSSLYEEKENLNKKFCPYKMRYVPVMPENTYIEYAADLNILLGNRKLIDNYIDNRNYFYFIASKFIRSKNMNIFVPDKIKKVDSCLDTIRKLENQKCSSIDEISHYFAVLTSEIFPIYNDESGKILKILGYNIGKWIYTIDAYNDLENDIKQNHYNPFVYNFNYIGSNVIEFKKSMKDEIQFSLLKCLDEASKAFELLDIKKNRGILENVIYLGLNRTTEIILEGRILNEKSI